MDRLPQVYDEQCNRIHPQNRGRIRHEIYEHVVFPVLLAEWRRGEAWAAYWLGKTWPNLAASHPLSAAIDHRDEVDLMRTAYEADPSVPEYRLDLLRALMARFNYIAHEWPVGLLLDPYPSPDWEAFDRDRALARVLDEEGRFSASLDELSTMRDAQLARFGSAPPAD